MKAAGEFSFPSEGALKRVYDHFQSGVLLDERFLVDASQWVRVDPRLGEIWCGYFSRHFKKSDPREFSLHLARVAFPQVAGVLIEQVLRHYALKKDDHSKLKKFLRFVMDGISPVPYQNFFIGVSSLSSSSVRKAAEAPSIPFARYGFYDQTVFRNKGSARESTDLNRKVRGRLLDEFIRRQSGRFTVEDYMESLPAGTSRRVAQLDLASSPRVRSHGQTRARFYRVK